VFKVRLKATAFRAAKVTFFYDILGLTLKNIKINVFSN
jgi:hypothetical protein